MLPVTRWRDKLGKTFEQWLDEYGTAGRSGTDFLEMVADDLDIDLKLEFAQGKSSYYAECWPIRHPRGPRIRVNTSAVNRAGKAMPVVVYAEDWTRLMCHELAHLERAKHHGLHGPEWHVRNHRYLTMARDLGLKVPSNILAMYDRGRRPSVRSHSRGMADRIAALRVES